MRDLLNPVVIADLRDMFDDDSEALCGLVEMFQSDARTRLVALTEAAGRGETSQVRAIAHAVKSSSRQIGAEVVGRLCEQVECGSSSADPDVVAAIDRAISAACLALNEAFTASKAN